jgi:hypothetical protein
MSAGQEKLKRDMNTGQELFKSKISAIKAVKSEFEGRITDIRGSVDECHGSRSTAGPESS